MSSTNRYNFWAKMQQGKTVFGGFSALTCGVAVICGVLTACSGSRTPVKDPPPGTMRLEAVTLVEESEKGPKQQDNTDSKKSEKASPKDASSKPPQDKAKQPADKPKLPKSILKNATMEEWPEGASAPTGFQAPKGNFSTIKPYVDENGRQKGVFQQWKKCDMQAPLSELFRANPVRLKPNTTYTLEVDMISYGSVVHAFSVYEQSEDKTVTECIAPAFLQSMRGSNIPQHLRGTFTTKEGKRVIIAVHAGEERIGNAVWLRWELLEK